MKKLTRTPFGNSIFVKLLVGSLLVLFQKYKYELCDVSGYFSFEHACSEN